VEDTLKTQVIVVYVRMLPEIVRIPKTEEEKRISGNNQVSTKSLVGGDASLRSDTSYTTFRKKDQSVRSDAGDMRKLTFLDFLDIIFETIISPPKCVVFEVQLKDRIRWL